MRASGAILLALVGAIFVFGPAAATTASLARSLLQSGVSCPVQIPACTPRRCTTRILNSKETYVCLRCMKGYVPVKGSDGKSVVQCVCPPGTYQVVNGSRRSCEPCQRGSYCPGGDKTARSAKPSEVAIGGQAVSCNPGNAVGLTTAAERATKFADCIALGGYVLPAQPGKPAVQCTGSTYAPANNRLKACLPCQSGLEAPADYSGPRINKKEVCQVPPGRFWESNVVRTCPQGLYREGYVKTDDRAAIACLSCMAGWTTKGIGSTSLLNCTQLLPGYMPDGTEAGTAIDESMVPQAAYEINADLCPYGYYNNGTRFYCAKCPMGSTTPWMGASSIDDCLVPPGYYIRLTGSGPDDGVLEKCPFDWNGQAFFRENWSTRDRASGVDPTQACSRCGTGVLGRFNDVDETPDIAVVRADANFPGLVASTRWSCYILPGWGLTVDPDNFNNFRALVPCPQNTYGVANETNGQFSAPCKACPKNMYSLEGSTSYTDCRNRAGFGYTTEGTNQCPDGFYAEDSSMQPCEQCPPGRTTHYEPGVGTWQQSIADCKVPAGYGIFSADSENPWDPDPELITPYTRAEKCPIGFFSTGDSEPGQWTENPVCQRCPDGQSTTMTGSTACDVCAPGWGIPLSKPESTDPTDCEPCPYGYYHSGGALRCSVCPETPFNHPVGDTYTSYGITFSTGLVSPDTCVPRYSQLPAPAGARLAIDPVLFQPRTATDMDFVSCLETCNPGSCCIAEWEAEGSICKTVELPPVGPTYINGAGHAALYYKLPPSGLIAAASMNDSAAGDQSSDALRAKTKAAGIYARCALDAQWQQLAKEGKIGTSFNPELVEEQHTVEWGQCRTETECRLACERNAACWGFIYIPGAEYGFALRGGEDQLGVRTFLVSPDFFQVDQSLILSPDEAAADPSLPLDPQEIPGPLNASTAGNKTTMPPSNAVCPAGTGGLFFCEVDCISGTINNGKHLTCKKCPSGYTSQPGSSRCSLIQRKKCDPGYGGAPACAAECQPGWYNDGSFGECRRCRNGTVSGPKAGNCSVPAPTECPAGRGGLPKCDESCRSKGMHNDGSSGQCRNCPAGQRPNKLGTGCVDVVTKCPAGTALGHDQEECSLKCTAPGFFNDGSFAACVKCPEGMSSVLGSTGATSCEYKVCPAGRGDAPLCEDKCSEGTFNDGTMSACAPCPQGTSSYPKRGGTKCV